jgi:hypothetical protein
MLIGTIAAPLGVLLLALGVVDATAAGAIDVSPATTSPVSAGFSDLAVHAASKRTAGSDNSVGRLMKRVMGSPMGVVSSVLNCE